MRIISGFIMALLLFTVTGCGPDKKNEKPKTEKHPVKNSYFGVTIEDPYQWLEDPNSDKVKKWIDEQNAYTEKILSGFTEGDFFTDRVKKLATTSASQFSPKLINGKLFFMQNTPPDPQPVIAYKEWPDGDLKILFDPNKEKEGAAVTDFWPSPKGNYLAYGTATGGSEATTIFIMNVSDGTKMQEQLANAGGGTTPAGLVWDADEKGFSYVKLPAKGSAADADLQFNAELYHHTLGTAADEDKSVFGHGLSRVAEYSFIASDESKSAAMFVHFGDGNPSNVYLRSTDGSWKQVMDSSSNIRIGGETNPGAAWSGSNLLIISYEDAPFGKLLSLSPDGKTKVVIDATDWAMNAVAAIKGGFLLTKVLGADWRIDQFDNNGKFVRTIKFPESNIGFETVASSDKSEQVLISYAGWGYPLRWAQYNSSTGDLKKIFEVKPAADYSNIKVSVVDAVSKDGTRVPVTVISMKGIDANGKRPTILYGYGGFGIATDPFFLGTYLAWLEKGGVLAYAHIRGGGEFGEGWHNSGKLERKQNVFDDMYAAAEAMVKSKWTDKEHLGLRGGSNGGLLMGALITQHPDAFKAAVSSVGIYDMLRNELFPNGEYNIAEYGTVKNEADFKWLYEYSPYHKVKPNTAYPAVLLETGVNDPRVAPWQSRKFAAALQEANTSDNPILLLTRMNEGHGIGASFSQKVSNTAVTLTFFAHELGLNVK